jgi:hypothetical protein
MHADQSKRNVDDLRNTIRIQQFVIVLLFGVVFIAMWAAKTALAPNARLWSHLAT